ncbi:peptidoglycan-binding protein [Streptomyces sp. NBC_00198]|uniref:peptidoglycan-binding protein n=1 Tax=Streptomyces sp. NBC_00198 TaxID=2975677 RepID=UPI00224F979C|nr:peptidoglycan-binding protein [Streptomyces sp. NBC_00198]MCX5285700.1 peptidoglycan-binding protein [Streptomyces sp. NBC_00198]MCX5286198.1 peptidoglycan-binding protein [Streptomyces sp. NBC_00198]
MPDLYLPGATRLDIGDHAPTDGGPAKAVPHITWDLNATAGKPRDLVPYEKLRDFFAGGGRGLAPHLLWNPFNGAVTQFVPATSRSKSLADASGGTRTNRAGSVVLQIEALFFPYCRVGTTVYPRLVDTPCAGWPEILDWARSWGVPDRWPNGRPESCTRDEHTWETEAGWYPHKSVPENTHDDPLSWPAFTIPAQPASSSEAFEPYPGHDFFMSGTKPAIGKQSTVFTRMGKRLVALGCGRYSVGPGPRLGQADVDSYEAWQRQYNASHHKGWSGTALKWPPGKETWDALEVPKA